MTPPDAEKAELDRLRADYLRLVRETLPAAAAAAKTPWPIRLDHCFMRVVLDTVFGRRWYDVLDRRKPAYRQLDVNQLHAAIGVATSMLDGGRSTVIALNRRSLAMRLGR